MHVYIFFNVSSDLISYTYVGQTSFGASPIFDVMGYVKGCIFNSTDTVIHWHETWFLWTALFLMACH